MLVTGNTSPRTRRRTDPVIGQPARRPADGWTGTSLAARRPPTVRPGPFRPPARGDHFFSIEDSRPSGEVAQIGSTSAGRQSSAADPMQEYFPRAWPDAGGGSPREYGGLVSARTRCESVPPETEATSPREELAARSATAPPDLDLSSPSLPNLADLRVRLDEMATAVAEEGQQKSLAQRRATITSAMGSRQHGRTGTESLCGTPRRRLLAQERAYLAARYSERPCPRTESFLDEALYGRVGHLSRECCDVLGPRACHQCDRLNRRSNSALRNEASFPSLHISAANFSTLTLVRRVRPELTARQVVERLARGDICRQSVRRKNSSERPGDSTDEEDSPPARKTSISAFRVPDGLGYFTNFTDLRAQIFARRQEKKRGGRSDRFKRVAMTNGPANGSNLPAITDVELVPKKEWERENSANYFGPPMLSRAEIQRQRSQPRFYAGARGEYQLPQAPSIDEISLKAAAGGAGHHQQQHQRLREVRSDTPDSDVSTWSLRSTPKDETASPAAKADTEVTTESATGQTEADPERTEAEADDRSGTDDNLMDLGGAEIKTYITELESDVDVSKE